LTLSTTTATSFGLSVELRFEEEGGCVRRTLDERSLAAGLAVLLLDIWSDVDWLRWEAPISVADKNA
jgi:hypothetical protein